MFPYGIAYSGFGRDGSTSSVDTFVRTARTAVTFSHVVQGTLPSFGIVCERWDSVSWV